MKFRMRLLREGTDIRTRLSRSLQVAFRARVSLLRASSNTALTQHLFRPVSKLRVSVHDFPRTESVEEWFKLKGPCRCPGRLKTT